jgi:hypothetical protein
VPLETPQEVIDRQNLVDQIVVTAKRDPAATYYFNQAISLMNSTYPYANPDGILITEAQQNQIKSAADNLTARLKQIAPVPFQTFTQKYYPPKHLDSPICSGLDCSHVNYQ